MVSTRDSEVSSSSRSGRKSRRMGTGSSESEEEKYSTGEDQDEVMISIAEKLKCLARERFAPSWRWHLSREQEKNCDIVVTNLICRVADFVGGKKFFSEECMVSKNMCVLEDSLYRMNRSTEIFRKGEYSKWKRNDRRQRICDIRDASSARESYVLQDGMSTDETVDHLQSLLTGQILDIVGPILSMLSCHKLNRGMFNSPVDYVKLEIPDYPNVIKRPMDLGTIRRKLHDGEYPNVERVASDVRLVFSNAMLFNQKRHYVHRAASGLLVIFEEAFEKTKAKCAQKRRKQLVHRCDFCQHGSTCPYCMCKCRTLASPSLNCEHCQFKIPPRTYYYYEEGTSRIWCPRCRKKRSKSQDTRNWFDRLTDKASAVDSKPSVSSTLAPSSTSSSLIVDTSDNDNRVEESIPPLTKCFNGIRISESWVSCAKCETRFHQACVLHNCWVKGKTFVCLRCRSKKKRPKAKTRVGRPPIDLPRAVDLPRSQLSDAVECRIRNVVRQEFDRNTPKVSRTNVRHRDSYQAVIDSFTFREVSRLQRTVQVSSSVNAAMGRAFPDEQFDAIYPAKMGHVSRALHLYQRIDGVDVIIFGMYVTEFSPDDPSPNRGSVYISYLDSVYYMRPRFLRTALYHSIMCEYLAYVKRRGHTNVHIWACPPMRSTDYVFHRHPRAQRTPGWERLRTWYNSMILRAHEEGTVVDVGTLYHDHFDRVRTRARRKGHAPPYLSQHFWLKQLASTVVSSKNPITNGPVARRLRSCSSGSGSERSSDVVASLSLSKRKTIGNAEDEPENKKKRRLRKESFLSSSTSASSSSPPSSSPPRATKLDGRSWAVAKDISNRLAPMAERLLVVRLQPLCESCGTYITKGTDDKIASWVCHGTCCDPSSERFVGKKKLKTRKRKSTQETSHAKPMVTAAALIRSRAHFCGSCVDQARLQESPGARLAKHFGHVGPLRREHRSRSVRSLERREGDKMIDAKTCGAAGYDDSSSIGHSIVDQRLAFLAFCSANHLQFDTLRHAKFSSMMILQRLLDTSSRSQASTVHYCNACQLPIESSVRWHCPKCANFDMCATCKDLQGGTGGKTCPHQHKLVQKPTMPLLFQVHVEPDPSKTSATPRGSAGHPSLRRK